MINAALLKSGGYPIVALVFITLLFPVPVWATFSARPYLPLESGNSWTYLVDDVSSVTTTVLPGTTEINGVATKALQSTGGFTEYYTNDASGIRLHRQFEPDVFIPGFGTIDLTVTYNPPIPITDALTDVEEIANSSGTAETSPNIGSFAYNSNFTVQAFENISVPLGNFGVVRIHGTITIVGVGTATATLYAARGIGVIKLLQSAEGITQTNELSGTNVVPPEIVADFEGDQETDIAVYETGTGNWFWDGSTSGFDFHLGFGGANFLPVPGDYDADGITDTAVYDTSSGNWFIAQSTAGFRIHPSFGGPGFVPVQADYDGDGQTDLGVYEPSTGNWFFVRSTLGFGHHLAFGGAGFISVPGDYDGDGQIDTAVYQTSTGHWFIAQSTAGFRVHPSFGGAGLIPIAGDYDGDGKTDLGVHQVSTGHWFFVRSTAGFGQHLAFGGPGFLPVPGDYDGDGKTDTAVYQQSTGHWFINQSTVGFRVQPSFGGPSFVPVLPQVTILRATGLF
jgi:hypothetical protein